LFVAKFVPKTLLFKAFGFVNGNAKLHTWSNRFAINRAVNVSRHRPHPWSTAHDYVSWTSLTDQNFSARHLPAKEINNFPAPETLVEFFRRDQGKQRLSSKSTCLFPAFAQYLTDGFIRTKMPKSNENQTVRRENTSNHQIDLCPLYGRTQVQTTALRLNSPDSGQRGQLKSQILKGEEYAPFLYENGLLKTEFADLDLPLGIEDVTDPNVLNQIFAFGGDRANTAPHVAMINTLFLREHNRIAKIIESKNPVWDDERVFQTARNTVIVLFIKIVVEEYINHISPVPFRFIADPSVAWNAPWNKPNWITTEFSMLYRWHSLIPDTISWNAKPYNALATLFNNRLLLEVGLAEALIELSTQPAGQLGCFNTADDLLPIEFRSIMQSRICQLASYSDYREYVSLPRPKDFADISKDSKTIDFLKAHYKSVDDVEFYIGLFAEEASDDSPLPSLIQSMVAVDAFSQALTNPLLSKHVFKPETFTQEGWHTILQTHTIKDVIERNANATSKLDFSRVSMTQTTWKHSWTSQDT
jgi:prostaglandin-endoperoxide synthase 2